MYMTRPAAWRQQAGFTIIELIVFIVVVSAGLAGILMVMDVSVKASADPMVRKQAMALADSVLEEVLLKSYDDPDGVSGETTRATFDDVSDFDGIDETLATPATGKFTGLPALLNGYRIRITVDGAATVGGVTARRVTVTVSRGGDSVSMSGYRMNY